MHKTEDSRKSTQNNSCYRGVTTIVLPLLLLSKVSKELLQMMTTNYLSLQVIASHNISDSTKSRNQHRGRLVPEKHTYKVNHWHNNPFNRYSRSSTHKSSCTNLGHTPASITAWILSFVPSERYDNAQQASVNTSSSLEKIKRSSAGSAGLTCPLNISSKNKLKDTNSRGEWTDKEIKGHYLLKWRLWLTPTKVR